MTNPATVASTIPEYWLQDAENIRIGKFTALANATVIPAFTPMKRDGSKKLVPCTAKTDISIGLTIPSMYSGHKDTPYTNGSAGTPTGGWTPTPIHASDFQIPIYVSLTIASEAINWASITDWSSTLATALLEKEAFFDGTGIVVTASPAGFNFIPTI